jgi:hypothetical protein
MNATTRAPSPGWQSAAVKNAARAKLEAEAQEQLREVERHINAAGHALRECMANHRGRGKFGVEIAVRLREVAALAGALAFSIDGQR